MALGARWEPQQAVIRERRPQQRVPCDEAADPRRGARAEAARGRDSVDARERAALEGAPRLLVGEPDAARDDVVTVLREPVRALAFDAHGDAVSLFGNDLVVERQRQAQRIEARAEIR